MAKFTGDTYLNDLKTRPGANDGVWLLFILPVSVIISALKHPIISTPTYKLTSLFCTGLILTSLIILVHLCTTKRLKVFTTWVLIVTGFISIVFHFTFTKGWTHSIINGSFCTVVYYKCYVFILKQFQECFTLGEAGVVIQGALIVLYCLIESLVNYVTNGQEFRTNMQISTIIIQLGLLGIATIAGFAYMMNIRSTKSFYFLVMSVIALVIFLPLHILLDRDPFLWIFQQLLLDNSTIKLIFYWHCCVGLAVFAVRNQIFYAQKASTATRKIFHILAVLVFVPGLLYRCSLLYLATGVVTGIFFALEILRILEVSPLAPYLQDGFVVFCDEKDTGNLALTPIYLLAGASLPIWIHPSPCDVVDSAVFDMLPLLSGILSIGIGDTAASIVGSNYGKFHWPSSKKTIEGTAACILFQIGFIHCLIYFGAVQNVTQVQLLRTYIAIVINSLVEARTTQVDNLILPLIMYILLI